MLSFAKARKDYYLQKVGEISPREDYYLRGGAATGRWHGSGAADVGLAGGVIAEGLVRLFDGQHPATGEQLGRQLRKDGVAAWDLTFSADKSVSLLWALGDDETRMHVVEAFGGSSDLMAATDPRFDHTMSQSGTFNANPLTMAAGLHALRRLTPNAIGRLNEDGDALRTWINDEASQRALPLVASGYGSLVQLHVGSKRPSSYRDAKTRPSAPLSALFYLLMERGVFTAPSRVIVALSTAMRSEQLDELRTAFADSFDVLASVGVGSVSL